MRTLPFLLILACGGSSDVIIDDGTDDTDTTPPTTPPITGTDTEQYILDLAAEVSQAEIETTIADLEAFGTRFTGTQGNHDAHIYLSDRLTAYGLDVEEDNFSFTRRHGGGTGAGDSTNLIARLEGTEDPDTVWIFSAHYDSTSTDPENYAPGADDNASGVAGVLEAARLLSTRPHRDSIWFVLTGAEEQGSEGSFHLAAWLASEPVEVRGVIAPDMIGFWPLGDGDAMDILGDEDSEHLVTSMSEVADVLGVAHKTWIHHYYCYGDDHTNYQESGVPAITPMDCVEAHNLPENGEDLPHYHKTTDTMDTLHLPFTTRVVGVQVAAISAWAEPLPL